jgi:hypothetical protein
MGDTLPQENGYCTTPRRTWIGAENADLQKAVFYQPRCKLWSCPFCAEANKAWWIAVGVHGGELLLSSERKLQFTTTTARRYLNAAQSVFVFRIAWPKLIRRVKYKLGYTPQYMLIPEHTKRGILHAHFIIEANLSKRFWKDKAFYSGMGYIAHQRKVLSAWQVGEYIGKHLDKQLSGQAWPKGFRRVRTSQGWPELPPPDHLPGWEYLPFRDLGAMNWEIHYLRDQGYQVVVSGDPYAFALVKLWSLPQD